MMGGFGNGIGSISVSTALQYIWFYMDVPGFISVHYTIRFIVFGDISHYLNI